MPDRRKRILSRAVRAVLASGRGASGTCLLPGDLRGSARNALLLFLFNNDLVQVRGWDACRGGDAIGPITDHGREVLERGWL